MEWQTNKLTDPYERSIDSATCHVRDEHHPFRPPHHNHTAILYNNYTYISRRTRNDASLRTAPESSRCSTLHRFGRADSVRASASGWRLAAAFQCSIAGASSGSLWVQKIRCFVWCELISVPDVHHYSCIRSVLSHGVLFVCSMHIPYKQLVQMWNKDIGSKWSKFSDYSQPIVSSLLFKHNKSCDLHYTSNKSKTNDSTPLASTRISCVLSRINCRIM